MLDSKENEDVVVRKTKFIVIRKSFDMESIYKEDIFEDPIVVNYDDYRNLWFDHSRAELHNSSPLKNLEFWEKYELDAKANNDGWIQLRIGHDPHNLQSALFDLSWMDLDWKRVFQTPWLEQKSVEWINLRKKGIRASDLHLVLALGDEFKTMNKEVAIDKAHTYLLNQKKDPSSHDLSNVHAIQHGNKYEDEAGYLHTWFWNDITFKFGTISHKNPDYRLAISPDLLSWKYKTPIELKAPAYRDILHNTTFEQSQELQVLEKECLLFGKDPKAFTIITNLSEEYVDFVNKLQAYWHQCQMQMEVIGFETDWMFFTQYGIEPNPHYKNQKPMITFTKVKKNQTWLQDNMPYFEKFWSKLDQ